MKRTMNQNGKVTITTILMVIILFYGAFAAYKIISSRLTTNQIKSEIIDKFGFVRGTDFTVQKGEEIIRQIMIAHNLYKDPLVEDSESGDEAGDEEGTAESTDVSTGTQILVTIEQGGSKLYFKVDYTDVVDLILFKLRPHYTVENEMVNYN